MKNKMIRKIFVNREYAEMPQERFFSYFDVELFSEQLTGCQIVNDLMNVQLLGQALRGDRPKAVLHR